MQGSNGKVKEVPQHNLCLLNGLDAALELLIVIQAVQFPVSLHMSHIPEVYP